MQKFAALTSLRFIAALLVFIHHYMCHHGFLHFGLGGFNDMGESWVAVLLYEMRYGVSLFFVLSGFLLLIRYEESIFRKVGFGTYWIKRFARIMPLYWTLLTLYFLLYREPWWQTSHYIIFYTLTQSFFFDIKWQGLGVAWSLTVEECFYLLLPLLIVAFRFAYTLPGWVWSRLPAGVHQWGARVAGMMPRTLQPSLASRWLPVGMGVLVLFAMTHLLWELGEYLVREKITDFAGFMGDKNDMRTYTIFGRFADFGVGMVFGLIYLKTRNRILRHGWLADLAIVASTIGVVLLCKHIYYEAGKWPAWDNLESPKGWDLNFWNAVCSGVVIYCLCSQTSWIARLLSWRPFQYLGEISFALYLLHYNMISVNLYVFVRDNQWSLIPSLLFVYGILTIASALCYEAIERPAQHLILEKTGALHGSVRRPTALRLIGFARRSKERHPRNGGDPLPC